MKTREAIKINLISFVCKYIGVLDSEDSIFYKKSAVTAAEKQRFLTFFTLFMVVLRL